MALISRRRHATEGAVSSSNAAYEQVPLVTLADSNGVPYSASGAAAGTPVAASTWTANHAPAANTQATIAKAAGAAGVKNVCTSITVSFAAGAAAPTAVNVAVTLTDGAAVVWTATLSLPATAGASVSIALAGLNIVGTAATAMTLAFSAAGGANTIEAVSMSGYQTT